eukprot:CAMPEP_0184653704 /NCGR_PEP_ID=MMETSP0308-20130426/11429_1 /TAXON_ID=38269 /ORGANISM="Gloeochaete witrockiana, Strain SAG 46.84" /LENGTH=58 /DNA_ID=CAMNT_0027089315 /DNA_START=185 /DNA_END=358 /DNA_ORIENTATION=+
MLLPEKGSEWKRQNRLNGAGVALLSKARKAEMSAVCGGITTWLDICAAPAETFMGALS